VNPPDNTSLRWGRSRGLFDTHPRGPDRVFFTAGTFVRRNWLRRHAEKDPRIFSAFVRRLPPPSRAAVARMRSQAEIVVGVHIPPWLITALGKTGGIFYPVGTVCRVDARVGGAISPDGAWRFVLVASDEPRTVEKNSPAWLEPPAFARAHPWRTSMRWPVADYIIGPPSTYSHGPRFHGNKPLLQASPPGCGRSDRNLFSVSFLSGHTCEMPPLPPPPASDFYFNKPGKKKLTPTHADQDMYDGTDVIARECFEKHSVFPISFCLPWQKLRPFRQKAKNKGHVLHHPPVIKKPSCFSDEDSYMNEYQIFEVRAQRA